MCNQINDKYTIVLAADSSYIPQVITCIKSICLHNKNILFYLMNRDIPLGFFEQLNQKLEKLNSQIIDIKITNEKIKNYKTYPHINSDSTFFRYFIPELIPQDKILYLDSDLVVNGSLNSLFSINLETYFIAAAEDIVSKVLHKKHNQFNAGVLLINNKKWKEYNLASILMEVSEQYIDQVSDADQGILNLVLVDKWLKLNRGYNYLIGADYLFNKYNLTEFLEDLAEQIPLIVHFNTEAKPWLMGYNIRFKELYWFYYFLDWQQIYTQHNLKN